MKQVSTKLYITAFFVTLIIFGIALATSAYISEQKTKELKVAEDKITVDILSLETEVDLLKDASCQSSAVDTLANELDSLSSRLAFMEDQVGTNNPDVYRLKRYYSLLEIKDYLLRKQLAKQCKTNDVFILYFYSTKNCDACTIQEYMLKAIKNDYPNTNVYSFDYNVDLQAVETLMSLHNIPGTPPIIDIQNKPYAAFSSYDDMKNIVEHETDLLKATYATSTKKTK